MRTVPVSAERAYQVEIGVDWKIALADWTEGRAKIVVITSENFPVKTQFKTQFKTIEVPDGESGKSSKVLNQIWKELGEFGVNRNDLIVSIGGGAVSDLAGFAASTWLRGIDWIAIPTTMAAMVDAAIGGKTGINSEHGKNLVGSFHSPLAVLIDLTWLETLSERDMAAGLAEVVKCGFIADSEILHLFSNKSLKDICNDSKLQLELIHKAVSVKASVVGSDFKESFNREILNYGHTLGHAIEKHANYSLRHGEAVSIGMCFIAELAGIKSGLPKEVIDQHYKILEALKLPTSYSKDAWPDLQRFMALDKKSKSGKIRFVSLNRIGECNRIEDASSEDLFAAYERISK